MHFQPAPTRHVLPRRGLMRIAKPQRLRLHAERGSLWITIDGEAPDIELDPGDTFVFERDVPATVSAFDDAVFTSMVDPSPPQDARHPWWRPAGLAPKRTHR